MTALVERLRRIADSMPMVRAEPNGFVPSDDAVDLAQAADTLERYEKALGRIASGDSNAMRRAREAMEERG